jgi:hypothetical protein
MERSLMMYITLIGELLAGFEECFSVNFDTVLLGVLRDL